MYKFNILFLVLCFYTQYASANILLFGKLKELEDSVDELEKSNTEHEKKINNLSDKLLDLQAESEFEHEINKLEERIAAIIKYINREKTKDIALRKQSEQILGVMEGKVDETKEMIQDLKDTVKLSVDGFQEQIQAVNVSAHLSVNVRGVVFYGGVGTACSVGSGECLVKSSECRDGRCQCEPGLSYNLQDRSCVPTCTKYGDTYQVVENYIIRGHNSEVIENITSMDACHNECKQAAEFTCRSVDLFPRWKTCYLSDKTKQDVNEDDWEYNSAGIHFQRDCAEV